MQRKKMTLRFDLDRPEDRQAWEYLQGLNPASMNKAVLTIINHADRANRVQGMIRSIFREELAAALLQTPVSCSSLFDKMGNGCQLRKSHKDKSGSCGGGAGNRILAVAAR